MLSILKVKTIFKKLKKKKNELLNKLFCKHIKVKKHQKIQIKQKKIKNILESLK